MSRRAHPLAALAEKLSISATSRREIVKRLENAAPVPLAPRRQGVSTMFGGGYVPGSDMVQFMDVYATDATVHPIVSRLAEATSEAEWKLYTEGASGTDEDRTEITSHAVLDLFDHPNDFQTMPEIIESGQQHWELVGETSIVLGFSTGIKLPLDMWVLRPDRIEPIPDAYEFLKGWVYRAPGDGERIPLATNELLRMRHPNPLDPYRGLGAVQALLRDLDAQRFTKEWQAQFFLNQARPGGIVQVDRRLEDDEWDEMRDRWEEQHRGVSKAHRVAILEHGAQWVETAFSLKDLQIAELENVGRDKALVAFGFPKAALGIVEDVNRANAEAGEYLFARWLVKPRLNRWKSMFNTQLLPQCVPGGRQQVKRQRLCLDYTDPVPENSEQALAELKTKADVVVALTGAGFEAAEVLELVSWPDLAYEKPAPPPVQVPGRLGAPAPALPPGQDEPADDTVPSDARDALILAYARLGAVPPAQIDAAMRWKVIGHPDSNCCEPCMNNIGNLYRSRSSAYSDYPGGKGYIKCVGAKFGNECRCKVIKRRSDS